MEHAPRLVAALTLLAAAACQVTPWTPPAPGSPGGPRLESPTDLQATAPTEPLRANWKHRLAQPYVFVEGKGSYTRVGELLEQAYFAMKDQGLEASGPPFALYYDDPGVTPVSELRMRACFPVLAPTDAAAPLAGDVLPSTTVVYAFVTGPYPEVPRSYPALFGFLDELGWVENGPVREVYLADPALVDSLDQLVTEVQIPSRNAR